MTGPPTILPPVSRTVTREQVERYADVSGDHNPIHVDEAFAADTRFGRPIAHGMLVLAFVSEMLTKALPALECGKRPTRFCSASYWCVTKASVSLVLPDLVAMTRSVRAGSRVAS